MKLLLPQCHGRRDPCPAPVCAPDPQRAARVPRRLAAGLAVALACLWPVLATAQGYSLRTVFDNPWFTPGPPSGVWSNFFGTNGSTVFFGGHALGNTNSTRPVGGGYALEWSSFGQPFEGLQSDVSVGDFIPAPAGTDTTQPPANFVAVKAGNNPAAYYQSTDPLGGAFWAPSSGKVIAAQPNNISIQWRTTNGGTNLQVVAVNAVPAKRPARLYWTESPYDAPKINLTGLFPVVHYNTEVPPPIYLITTNVNGTSSATTTNVVSGVWIDDQKQLHAKNVSGMFIVEYYQEGSYKDQVQPDGLELVQVMEPDLTILQASVGSRLLPVDTYWAQVDTNNGISPNVTVGINDTVFVNSLSGPKDNWVYAVKRTYNDPWALEIYWQHMGRMHVLWPFEVDWYSCDWPQYPQRYVHGDTPASDSPPVLFPAELTAELMEDMDPPLHATLSPSKRSFTTTQPGHCLLKYTTASDLWFEVVQTVSHTNETYFDLAPKEWPIGLELNPGDPAAHAMRFDGTNDYVSVGQSLVNQLNAWTLSLRFNAARLGTRLYSEGDGVTQPAVSVHLTAAGELAVHGLNTVSGQSPTATTHNAGVRTNHWYQLAVTYSQGSDTNGVLSIWLDNTVWNQPGFARPSTPGLDSAFIATDPVASADPSAHPNPSSLFQGKLDEVRVWSAALTGNELSSNRFFAWSGTAASLIADFPFFEGQGSVIHNLAGDHNGSAIGNAAWCYGEVVPIEAWSSFPGYIHTLAGNRYNVNRYAYPTESSLHSASSVFAVNTGPLEVWWANQSLQVNMPPVYYPSRVVCYSNTWPDNPPEIVIASGLGSTGDSLVSAPDALSFGSLSNNYVSVSSQAALRLGDELTVEAWVKLDERSETSQIVSWSSKDTNGNLAAGFNLNAGGTVVIPQVFNALGTEYFVQGANVPPGVWTHLAMTYKAGDVLAGFINGRLVASCPVATQPIAMPSGDLALGRGSSDPGAGAPFQALGEVRLWSVARSPAEIAASFRSRLQGKEAGLLAYYPCVRSDNPAVLTDEGPFHLHGAINGPGWTAPGWPLAAVGSVLPGSATIYAQNDHTLPGYNPNEEHALVLGGVVYALRNDLNTSNSSAAFVLMDYLDSASLRPKMKVFSVIATNSEYGFERTLTAGLPIQPIMPLSMLPACTNTSTDNPTSAWRDRKCGWWAVAAGDNGGPTNAVMRFYYQMQPTFWFPDLAADQQPPIGQELPWLPALATSTYSKSAPVPVVYHLSWPGSVPQMKLGQTLTVATRGLPDVWNQLSVDIAYDQSERTNGVSSVVLFDPAVGTGVDLDRSVITALLASQLARQDLTSPRILFPELPPSISPRLYYDPNRGTGGQLVLEGQLVSTLTGSGYLLLNMLSPAENTQVTDLASALDGDSKAKWAAAVTALPKELTLIKANTPYVNAALGALLTNGVGYVTLAFNNSTNTLQVDPALPVSIQILQVIPQLYSGDLEVITPDDALAEQLSLHYGPDLAGQAAEADFQWRFVEPLGGLIPSTNFLADWSPYGTDPSPGTNEVSLSGANPFVMADHYFAVRYRPTAQNGPSGTNWSDWTYNLAPGWVKRAMTGVNPFEQIFHDRVANAVDTRVTMISQAGGPYEGDVALNLPAASGAGLIATYQTIFNRAKAFSIDSGLSDPGMNQTLLFAASRLHDLYMLLGNEAFADAQDPTIAFPSSLSTDEHGADATSLFAFMNQVPNLLEEELALLRGRDGTLAPSVQTSPTYNRLIWNYTQGINGGEAAYAYNYNIKGTPTNTAGLITAADAKRLYPQGHGDAWGHYLSAISSYYDLLSYENFAWQTEPESTLIGNAAVSTDYFDEQKFAETAAARARTGVAIVKQTFRQRYSEDPTGRWAGYTDSNTNRAWGIGEWASRAGQAAYYDWAVANSLMLDVLTNLQQIHTNGASEAPEGIQKIDRASTPELNEIARNFQAIQSEVDGANNGLNPLGLARNTVPFDIDPAAIDGGQTHFEQIYDRATTALFNACVAFDHARGVTLALRDQADSVADLEEALTQNETDYHNRLIQLYGNPYPDDIGAGKSYPQGYAGPDLLNWQILDLENLLGTAPTGQVMTVQVSNLFFHPNNDFSATDPTDYTSLAAGASVTSSNVGTITVCMADNGLKVKPPGWTSHRPAQGDLQLALSDFVQAWYATEGKIADYNQTLADLKTALDHQMADYVRYPTEWEQGAQNAERKKETANVVEGLEIAANLSELIAGSIKDGGETSAELIPKLEEGFALALPSWMAQENPGAVFKAIFNTTYWISMVAAHALEVGAKGRTLMQEKWDVDLEELLKGDEYKSILQWNTADTLVKLKGQYVKQAELLAQVEALSQSFQRVQKLLADGQRLLAERAQVRARAAQRIQGQRYADISFRIFRDDALRRYQASFDLAAQYTYLAAKAYDYETGLLNSDTARTPGSRFLEAVVRARLPGRFYVWLGTPLAGGATGEPGLADILARMKGDWDVVKGRFGFNNPDTETSRFSLRTELLRISPTTSGDGTWAQTLENCRVANLHDLPEFIRYCRPYTETTNIEPALVIPFSTFVVAGQNYFGHDLAGGDNAYDASHAATKIRSAGVWFTGYNATNTTGEGLGNEPRVYLIPVGQDVMRSPTRNGIATRSWTVLDQAIPLPYNVGGADVDDPDWIPVMHSLREPMAQLRRYSSLRAYHDDGDFDSAETCNNSRLVGRSVWNTRWLLIIPGRTLLADPNEGIERLIHGAQTSNGRDGAGIKDIKVFFQTYSISGD